MTSGTTPRTTRPTPTGSPGGTTPTKTRLAQVAVERGRARFELTLASRDGEVTPYTVTVHAKDEFGRIVPATTEVEVYSSGVGLVPDLALERPLRLKVFARRVGTAERLPNRAVRARVIRSTWEFVSRDGWRERVLRTERFSLTTDARGEAGPRTPPKAPAGCGWRQSYQAEREVFVPVPGKRLEVKVSVPGGLRPGQRATVNVQTTLGGQPVAAWVGVGAVNRAVYALQEDLTPTPARCPVGPGLSCAAGGRRGGVY